MSSCSKWACEMFFSCYFWVVIISAISKIWSTCSLVSELCWQISKIPKLTLFKPFQSYVRPFVTLVSMKPSVTCPFRLWADVDGMNVRANGLVHEALPLPPRATLSWAVFTHSFIIQQPSPELCVKLTWDTDQMLCKTLTAVCFGVINKFFGQLRFTFLFTEIHWG